MLEFTKLHLKITAIPEINMAAPLSVYLFGDQTAQFRDDLGALLLVGGNPILNTFLDQAALGLRQEIQSLARSQRDQFPSFCNFLDLLAIDPSKPLHPALQLSLSSVHHFALFLWLEHHGGDFSDRYTNLKTVKKPLSLKGPHLPMSATPLVSALDCLLRPL